MVQSKEREKMQATELLDETHYNLLKKAADEAGISAKELLNKMIEQLKVKNPEPTNKITSQQQALQKLKGIWQDDTSVPTAEDLRQQWERKPLDE